VYGFSRISFESPSQKNITFRKEWRSNCPSLNERGGIKTAPSGDANQQRIRARNGVAYSLHCPSRPHPNDVFLGISGDANPLEIQQAVQNHVDYETVALTT